MLLQSSCPNLPYKEHHRSFGCAKCEHSRTMTSETASSPKIQVRTAHLYQTDRQSPWGAVSIQNGTGSLSIKKYVVQWPHPTIFPRTNRSGWPQRWFIQTHTLLIPHKSLLTSELLRSLKSLHNITCSTWSLCKFPQIFGASFISESSIPAASRSAFTYTPP